MKLFLSPELFVFYFVLQSTFPEIPFWVRFLKLNVTDTVFLCCYFSDNPISFCLASRISWFRKWRSDQRSILYPCFWIIFCFDALSRSFEGSVEKDFRGIEPKLNLFHFCGSKRICVLFSCKKGAFLCEGKYFSFFYYSIMYL